MSPDVFEHYIGEKRYYGVEFRRQKELVNGETLSAVTSVSIDPSTGFTITLPVISGSQARFWIESSSSAEAGDHEVSVTCTTSGGATVKEKCRLEVLA